MAFIGTIARHKGSLGRASRGLPGIVKQLFNAYERAKSRRSLAELDDHLLRDVGIDPHQAYTESSRPFWDGV